MTGTLHINDVGSKDLSTLHTEVRDAEMHPPKVMIFLGLAMGGDAIHPDVALVRILMVEGTM